MEKFKKDDIRRFDERSDYKQVMVLTNYDPNEMRKIVEQEYKIKPKMK